ncbi:MAG: hypothetical protein JNK84_17855 [Phreatobacter sp.]|uniref:hypothetical protein n=1 Tax=Phreatobacter sp. TaxID=1966341 RepID=UPI001A533C05|nr:hypothetical protein [Phreatobacter sp.]MBL8570938.1 hypothetical protein [Phreatobacter sp.]
MRAKEAIPILSEAWGVPMETAWVLDRSLADAGLRQKVKGRNPPHMTLREGIHFLLACMTYKVATKAADDVAYWSAFRWKPIDADCKERGSIEDAERNAALGALSHRPDVGVMEFGDDACKVYPTGYKQAVVDVLAGTDDGASLVDYLMALSRWLVAVDAPTPGDIKLEIVPSNDHVAVVFSQAFHGEIHTDFFFRADDGPSADDDACGIHRSVYVYGDALQQILARTEGLERR